jgi:hypothetical protein
MLRTARTLPVGEWDLAMSLNLAQVSVEGYTDAGETVPADTLPNVLPELLVHHGADDNLELGGRLSVGSGLLELNAKYRFLRTSDDTLHVAAAPAIGYRVIGPVRGAVFTLPVMLTWDVSKYVSVSGGPLLSYSIYHASEWFSGGFDSDRGWRSHGIGGETLYAGAGAGVQFRLLGVHLMPGVELHRSLSRSVDSADADPGVSLLFVTLTFGWNPA